MNSTRKLVYTALLLALGILLPMIFHTAAMSGVIFLPMHIPILLAGFIVGPWYAALLGFITPIINHLLTGMPPVPVVYTMTLELIIFGIIAGLMYQNTNRVLLSLLVAMIGGRIVAACGIFILAQLLTAVDFSFKTYFTAAFVTGIPGLIIQIILIPLIVTAYEKSTIGYRK
ncbi:MAG: ECF transporter S component [Tissierellia bacterium]|nr:ECF transporter S component [Tissierellia bacterium]